MHTKSAFKKLLKIDKIVIEDMYFEYIKNSEDLVVRVRPVKRELYRCPMCAKVCIKYDRASKIKRWWSLDFGSTCVYLEAYAPRVKCREHGVITAHVPWAGHGSEFTKDFETAVTWLSYLADTSCHGTGCFRVF